MACPASEIKSAVAKCPFLHAVAERNGESYAMSIATNPLVPASSAQRRPVLEDVEDFRLTFRLFHGEDGVVPLLRVNSASSCPHMAKAAPGFATSDSSNANMVACKASLQVAGQTPSDGVQPLLSQRTSPLAAAPLATMSMGFGGGLPDFGRMFKALQQKAAQRRLPNNNNNTNKPQRPGPQASATGGSTGSVKSGPPPSNGNGGLCPMRKALGPLAPLVFNAKGHLQCPEPIVKMRAALAATKPVKQLRPQALFVKILAIAGLTASVNVPCGMVREHTKKFGLGWIIAVHATIPFIAMLRKAVIMPKYAIVFTIAAAIAGQTMGARLERKRLSAQRSQPAARIVSSTAPESRAALASISQAGMSAEQSVVPQLFQMNKGKGAVRVKQSSGMRGAVPCAITVANHRLLRVPTAVN